MKKNQLKGGVILSYVSLILGNGISILYTPIMIRLLGQAEYGLTSLSNTVIGYLGIMNLGLGNAIVRYTTKYRVLGDKEEEYNLNGMFFIIYSILGLIVVSIGIILIANINSIFGKTLHNTELIRIRYLMVLMLFNLAISFPFGIFSSIISAYERFIFPKVIEIISSIVNPLVMLPLLFMGYKSIAMAVASTVINLLCIAVNVYYCFKVLKIKIKFNSMNIQLLKEIFIYSFFIFINIIVDKIYWSTDQFILGAVSGTVAVAIYTIGSTFNSYYMSFSTAISNVFLPKITKMVTKNASDEEVSDLFIRTGRIQYVIMSFILCGFILVGRDFINIWAGDGYEESFFIAIVVMIPLTIPLIQNVGLSILQAKNMHKFRSNIYLVIAILNLLASVPLAKVYGGIGAAISTGLSFTIGNIIIMNIYYYKKVNIDIPRFWKEIGNMSLPVLLSLGAGFIASKIIVIGGLLGIILKAMIFTVIFAITVWKMSLNNYERELFIGPFKSLLYKFQIKRGIV